MRKQYGLRSIKVSVLGVSLIPLAVLLLVVAIVWQLQSQTAKAAAIAQNSDDVLLQAHRIQNDLSDAAISIDTARLRVLVRDSASQSAIAERLSRAAAQKTHGSFRQDLSKLEQAESRLRDQRRTAMLRLWTAMEIALIGSALLGVIVTVIVSLILRRRVVLRLRRLADQTMAFAERQTILAPLTGGDEVADVSRTIHDMSTQVIRYRLLAEHVRDIILFAKYSDGRILEANSAAAKAYGYSRSELLALTIAELHSPPERASMAQTIESTALHDVFIETVHQRRDGGTFPVEVSAQSVVLTGERIVIAIVRDVSERHATDDALRAALNQAMEASRLKSAFVATMSHEIRTPMNGVVGMTELLLDTPLTNEQREYAATVKDSAHSLLVIINDILDFSKIEAGKIEVESVEFDVVSKIENIASMLAEQAYANQISLTTCIDPAVPPYILGDPGRLRQVLVNLVGNAIKFTSHGGVTLTADLVSSTPQGARIRFAVRDTGIGIDPKTIPMLFEAFRQADGTTTRYGGTGLGLTISQQLVELMGGTIKVESSPGAGSTFSFILDFRVQGEPEPAKPKACGRRYRRRATNRGVRATARV